MNKKLSKLSHLVLAFLLVILPTLLLVTQGNTAIIRAQTAPNSPPVSPPDITPTPTNSNETITVQSINYSLFRPAPGIVNVTTYVDIINTVTSKPIPNAKVNVSIIVPNNSSFVLSGITNEYGRITFYQDLPRYAGTYYIDVTNVTADNYIYVPTKIRTSFTLQPEITPSPTTAPSPTATPTKAPTATPTPTSMPTPTGKPASITGNVIVKNYAYQTESLTIYILKKNSEGIYYYHAGQTIQLYYSNDPHAFVDYVTDYTFPDLNTNDDYQVASYVCKRTALGVDCGFKGTITYCSGTTVPDGCQTKAPGKTNFVYNFSAITPTGIPIMTPTPTKAPTATPTPTSMPTPTPITGTNVTVRASGSVCLGAYPIMVLKIGGVEVKRWNQVTSTIQDYAFTSSYKYTGAVTVHFINDCYRPPEDRNLFVDYITINGKTIQSEAPGVYNTGGYGEWLWSNGFIQYPTTITIPSPTPTIILPSPTPYTQPAIDPLTCERNYSSTSTCEAPINCIRNGGATTDTYCGVSSFCCLH